MGQGCSLVLRQTSQMLSQVLHGAHEGYQGIVKINIGCEPKFGLRKCAIISDGWTYAADRSTFRTLARWNNWCPTPFLWRSYHAFNHVSEDDRSANANLKAAVNIHSSLRTGTSLTLCQRNLKIAWLNTESSTGNLHLFHGLKLKAK